MTHFQKQEGKSAKLFLDILEEQAWDLFNLHELLNHGTLIHKEVAPRPDYIYNDKTYTFTTYCCIVQKIEHILPAFTHMINTFYSEVSNKDIVIVRQRPQIEINTIDNGNFVLSFRAVIVDKSQSNG